MSTMDNLTTKRFVCFVDILGFSEMVKKYTVEAIVDKFHSIFTIILNSAMLEMQENVMSNISSLSKSEIEKRIELIREAQTIKNEKGKVITKDKLDAKYYQISHFNYMIVSDSIIMYSNPILEKDDIISIFDEFCSYVRSLFFYSFSQDIRLRGALSYGEFYVDSDNSIYFGKALIEAYKFEGMQEWIGCSLCDSLNEIASNFFAYNTLKRGMNSKDMPKGSLAKKMGALIVAYSVPLKDNQIINRYIINWYAQLLGRINLSRNFFDELLTGNPKIDIKYKNTLDYMFWWENTIKNKWGFK
jgi:hypothetical protein